MEKKDVRCQTLERLHERRKQVARLHLKDIKTMQIVSRGAGSRCVAHAGARPSMSRTASRCRHRRSYVKQKMWNLSSCHAGTWSS